MEFGRCWMLEGGKRVIELFVIQTITELHSQGKSRGIMIFFV